MKSVYYVVRIQALLLFLLYIALPARAAMQVDFVTSCSPEVRQQFNHAVTLLHSFEYPETTRLFAEIIEQDPGCAMARWGAAMSIWHPLWAPPSEAELAAGAAVLRTTATLEATQREWAYIEAISTFFSSTDTSSTGPERPTMS